MNEQLIRKYEYAYKPLNIVKTLILASNEFVELFDEANLILDV